MALIILQAREGGVGGGMGKGIQTRYLSAPWKGNRLGVGVGSLISIPAVIK
jgi:hypothetical protein